MIKQAAATIASRVVIAACGLLVSVLAGHHLGKYGLGLIGLIVLGISLCVLAANVLGGSALVYLVPRVPLKRLLLPAYGWAVLTCALGYVVLRVFALVPPGFAEHVALLALMQAAFGIHLNVLVGQGRIRAHNTITVVQAVVLLAAFAALLLQGRPDVMAYVHASYLAFGGTLLLSLVALRPVPPSLAPPDVPVLRLMFRQGAFVQSANAMQLLNYRAAFWYIERYWGIGVLGIYNVACQLSESAWLAPKSLGLILYSRVSNTVDPLEQRQLTLALLKAAVGSAWAVVLVLLVLPAPVFSWAFGKEITGLFPVMLVMAPGIVSMAGSQAFSHFFSGTGRNRHNVIGSGIGLVATVVAGLLLIPRYGTIGAAATASVAYGLNALYQTAQFMRITGAHWRSLLPSRSDLARLKLLLQRT